MEATKVDVNGVTAIKIAKQSFRCKFEKRTVVWRGGSMETELFCGHTSRIKRLPSLSR